MSNDDRFDSPPGSPLSSRVTLLERDGRVVVNKEHPTPGAARAEARWLAAAPTRGVVRLVAHDASTTTTEHVPGPTLRMAELREDHAATVVISLASTLAELEDRDMAHGAITPDHVIVNGSNAVVCSPAKVDASQHPGPERSASPSTDGPPHPFHPDAAGLGRCLAAIGRNWHENGQAHSPTWTRLEHLLASDNPPSPRRVARVMAPLARTSRPEPDRHQPTETGRRRRQSRVGILSLSGFVTVALVGLWFTNPGSDVESPSHQVITIDRERFGVGTTSDAAVGLDRRCPGQAAAVLLDEAGTVWTFAEARDGAAARRAMTVPGASDLEVRAGDDGCPMVVVHGPAGRSELQWVER